jgi:hypothetical protein
LDVVGDKGDFKSSEGCIGLAMPFPISNSKSGALTCVDGGDGAFYDNDWKSIQTSQKRNDLLQCRKLSDHVQENRNHRTRAEKQARNSSITLARPFREHKSLGTLASDNGAQSTEYQERKRRR